MKEIQEYITNNMVQAAKEYALLGIQLLDDVTYTSKNPQVTIGNLSIATELLVKAYISKHAPSLLFKGLPKELRCALAAPRMTPESPALVRLKNELKSSKYKSIDLQEVFSIFFIFFPDFKAKFTVYIKSLLIHRNNCIHLVFPEQQEYEVAKILYLLISVIKYIEVVDEKLFCYNYWSCNKMCESFLNDFDENKHRAVVKKINDAKEKAKNLTEMICLESRAWNWYPIKCPVCKSDGMGVGRTDIDVDIDYEFGDSASLIFTAEIFKCDRCGLKLNDYDEMKIAGIDPNNINRPEDYNLWLNKQSGSSEDSCMQ